MPDHRGTRQGWLDQIVPARLPETDALRLGGRALNAESPHGSGGGGTPYWPAFDPARHRIQELTSAGIAPEASFGAHHQCAFWAQIER